MSHNRNLIVVNFYGGPATGKTAAAGRLLSDLKVLGRRAALVSEVAQDCVWDQANRRLNFQPVIFGEQAYRLHRLIGVAEVAVTDSPVLLSAVYNRLCEHPLEHLEPLCFEVHSRFSNINFYLDRPCDAFQPEGRRADLDETASRAIDEQVRALLRDRGIEHETVPATPDRFDRILSCVLRRMDATPPP